MLDTFGILFVCLTAIAVAFRAAKLDDGTPGSEAVENAPDDRRAKIRWARRPEFSSDSALPNILSYRKKKG